MPDCRKVPERLARNSLFLLAKDLSSFYLIKENVFSLICRLQGKDKKRRNTDG